MIAIEPITLQGFRIILEPLNETHRNHLHQAAQDKNIWTYISSSAFSDKFDKWFNHALTQLQIQQSLPFAVRRIADHKIIGSTRFYDIIHEHCRITIGHTWYVPEVWGSFVNPECKYILLKHAFEDLQVNRVEFVTDSRNARSRAAIKKLGAIEEGLLRQHMIVGNNYVRDTFIFSIIQADWPQVKLKLLSRIKQFDENL